MSKVGHNIDEELTIDWSDYDGFIVESRASRSHPLIGYGKQVKPADEARRFCYSVNEAWRDLLHECRYADGYVMNGGRRMLLERGALVGAISYLAYRWNWTPKTVRGFLDRLEADGMIAMRQPGINPGCTQELNGHQIGRQKGTQAQIISVCNYDKFNTPPDAQGHAQGHAEGTPRAREGHAKGMNHNKETNKQLDSPLPPTGGPTPLDALRAFEAYNATALRAGLAQASSLTPDRRKRIIARLREHGIGSWDIAMANLAASPFLTGTNDRNWRASLDFVVQTKSYAKLIEGAYGQSPNGPAPVDGKSWGWWRGKEEVLRALPVERWRAAVEKSKPNGTWPWWVLGAPPGDPECLVPKEIIDEHGYEAIYRGGIRHV